VDKIKWKAETPTENGFYWLKEDNETIVIVEVNDIDLGLKEEGSRVRFCGDSWENWLFKVIKESNCSWYGPLEIPK
jgi:hypothetical protein